MFPLLEWANTLLKKSNMTKTFRPETLYGKSCKKTSKKKKSLTGRELLCPLSESVSLTLLPTRISQKWCNPSKDKINTFNPFYNEG